MTSNTETMARGFPLVIPTKSMLPNARLVLRNDLGQVIQQWLIRQSKCTLGSASSCTLRCDAPGIAPYHALIVVGARQVFVRALAPRLSRGGVPVGELLLTDDENQFEIAGHNFCLMRRNNVLPTSPRTQEDVAAEGGHERLRFTLARPLEINRRRAMKSQPKAPTVLPEDIPHIDSKWVARLVQEAIEPLECQLQNVLMPLTELQAESRKQGRLRKQLLAESKTRADRTYPTPTDPAVARLPEQLDELAARQASAVHSLSERIESVNQQLSIIEELVHQDVATRQDASTSEIAQRDAIQNDAIEQLQTGMVSVSSALQDLEKRQQQVREEDRGWKAEIQTEMSALRTAVEDLASRNDELSSIAAVNDNFSSWRDDMQEQFQQLQKLIHEAAERAEKARESQQENAEDQAWRLEVGEQFASMRATLETVSQQIRPEVTGIEQLKEMIQQVAERAEEARENPQENAADQAWRLEVGEQFASMRATLETVSQQIRPEVTGIEQLKEMIQQVAERAEEARETQQENAADQAWRLEVGEQFASMRATLETVSQQIRPEVTGIEQLKEMIQQVAERAEEARENPQENAADQAWRLEVDEQFASIRAALETVSQQIRPEVTGIEQLKEMIQQVAERTEEARETPQENAADQAWRLEVDEQFASIRAALETVSQQIRPEVTGIEQLKEMIQQVAERTEQARETQQEHAEDQDWNLEIGEQFASIRAALETVSQQTRPEVTGIEQLKAMIQQLAERTEEARENPQEPTEDQDWNLEIGEQFASIRAALEAVSQQIRPEMTGIEQLKEMIQQVAKRTEEARETPQENAADQAWRLEVGEQFASIRAALESVSQQIRPGLTETQPATSADRIENEANVDELAPVQNDVWNELTADSESAELPPQPEGFIKNDWLISPLEDPVSPLEDPVSPVAAPQNEPSVAEELAEVSTDSVDSVVGTQAEPGNAHEKETADDLGRVFNEYDPSSEVFVQDIAAPELDSSQATTDSNPELPEPHADSSSSVQAWEQPDDFETFVDDSAAVEEAVVESKFMEDASPEDDAAMDGQQSPFDFNGADAEQQLPDGPLAFGQDSASVEDGNPPALEDTSAGLDLWSDAATTSDAESAEFDVAAARPAVPPDALEDDQGELPIFAEQLDAEVGLSDQPGPTSFSDSADDDESDVDDGEMEFFGLGMELQQHTAPAEETEHAEEREKVEELEGFAGLDDVEKLEEVEGIGEQESSAQPFQPTVQLGEDPQDSEFDAGNALPSWWTEEEAQEHFQDSLADEYAPPPARFLHDIPTDEGRPEDAPESLEFDRDVESSAELESDEHEPEFPTQMAENENKFAGFDSFSAAGPSPIFANPESPEAFASAAHDDASASESAVDAVPPVTAMTSAQVSEEEGEDGSVEDYMRKLLARMRGVPEEDVELPATSAAPPAKPVLVTGSENTVPGAVGPESVSLPDEDSPTAAAEAPTTDRRATDFVTDPYDPDTYVPRVLAPEKVKNLAAMRELANSSARTAIHSSTRKRHFASILLKASISLVGMMVAGVLIAINGLQVNIGLVATVAALLVAAIWGYDALSSVKPLIQSNLVLKPQQDDAPEESEDEAMSSQ